MPADRRLLALVVAVALAGAFAIVSAFAELRDVSPRTLGFITILGILTTASGRFSIKIPGRSASISVSEVFVFTSIFLVGAPAAIVIVAADGLVVSLRQKHRRLYRTLFNIAEPSVSVWLAGTTFVAVADGWASFHILWSNSGLFLATLAMSATFLRRTAD